jgi:hypothetical protein
MFIQVHVIRLRARLCFRRFGRLARFGQKFAQQLPRLGAIPLSDQS